MGTDPQNCIEASGLHVVGGIGYTIAADDDLILGERGQGRLMMAGVQGETDEGGSIRAEIAQGDAVDFREPRSDPGCQSVEMRPDAVDPKVEGPIQSCFEAQQQGDGLFAGFKAEPGESACPSGPA